MNLFEVVKTGINTREAAQVYGIDVNHYGMALCPLIYSMISCSAAVSYTHLDVYKRQVLDS